MKIIFVANHRVWGGLANNGGSKTIIRSAETLKELGHTVKILTNSNKYTWHDPKVKIIKKVKHPDRYDVAIAVSVSEIKNTIEQFPKSRHFWWVRGLETWRMPEKKIIKKAKKIEVLVNSDWLLDKFPHGRIAYAGLDLDFWREGDWKQRPIDVIQVGCLYNSQHQTKKWKDFKNLWSTVGDVEHSWVGFGLEEPKDATWLDHYEKNPSPEKLRKLYQSCHIWYLPSTLEGFCNVGAEAGLSGCLCVYRNIDSGGTKDYCTPETAVPFQSFEESVEIVESLTHEQLELKPLPQSYYRKMSNMQKLLKEKIGSRRKCMKRFVKLIGG